MMETYNELWNDYDFVFDRSHEQVYYIREIELSDRPDARKKELIDQARFVYQRFLAQRRKLMRDPNSNFLRKRKPPFITWKDTKKYDS